MSEIAFINTLEAQNRKIEVLERHQGHEARLLDLQEGRQRRREEQQAKEEAVQVTSLLSFSPPLTPPPLV